MKFLCLFLLGYILNTPSFGQIVEGTYSNGDKTGFVSKLNIVSWADEPYLETDFKYFDSIRALPVFAKLLDIGDYDSADVEFTLWNGRVMCSFYSHVDIVPAGNSLFVRRWGPSFYNASRCSGGGHGMLAIEAPFKLEAASDPIENNLGLQTGNLAPGSYTNADREKVLSNAKVVEWGKELYLKADLRYFENEPTVPLFTRLKSLEKGKWHFETTFPVILSNGQTRCGFNAKILIKAYANGFYAKRVGPKVYDKDFCRGSHTEEMPIREPFILNLAELP